MKIKIFSYLLMLMLAGSPVWGETPNQVDKNIQELKQVVSNNPSDSAAYYNLGAFYSRKGQWDLAIDAFQSSVNIAPNQAMTHAALGFALTKKKRWEDAIRAYQRAIELEPNLIYAHEGLVNTYHSLNLGELEERERAKLETLNHQTSGTPIKESQPPPRQSNEILSKKYTNPYIPENTSNLSQAELRTTYAKNLEEAVNDPHSADDYNAQGMVYASKKQLDKAFTAWKKALRINPEFAPALSNMAFVYAQQGNKTQAIKYYEASLNANPSYTPPYIPLMSAYCELSEMEKAENLYQKYRQYENPALLAYFKGLEQIKTCQKHPNSITQEEPISSTQTTEQVTDFYTPGDINRMDYSAQDTKKGETPMDSTTLAGLGWFALLAVLGTLATVLYFIPAILAALFKNANWLAVLMVNLFFGWSGLGWIIALLMAIWKKEKATQQVVYIQPNGSNIAQPEHREDRA